MKKTSHLGLSLLLILALAAPAWSQAPQAKTRQEYDAYMAAYNEPNPQKKAELAEKFLAEFKDSEFRRDAHLLLLKAYVGSKNCPKTMELSDRYAALAGVANDSKVNFYIEALNCAQDSGDMTKIENYADKILALDANDLNAQLVLATTLPERLPTDETQKQAKMKKAEDLANKAIAGIKALGNAVPEAQKNELLGQLHASLGLIHLTRQAYEPAVDAYQESTTLAPKDWVARYRFGLAYRYQMPDASTAYKDAFDAAENARKANADRVLIDELIAKYEGLGAVIRDLRDKAIDQFAFAVAIGSNQAQPAKDELVKLWKQKNNESDAGLEEFINQKKAELSSR